MALIKRYHPIVLPPRKWTGEVFDWAGKILQWSNNADLPIAWLQEQALARGCTINFVGRNANKQGSPLRVPMVLMGSVSDLVTNSPLRERFEDLGVIHTSLPYPVHREDGEGVWQSSYHAGFPARGSDPTWLLVDPEEYLGGKLFISIGGGYSFGVYETETYSDDSYDYTAQPGSSGQCGLYGLPTYPDPVDDSIPHTPLSVSWVAKEARTDADAELFLAHAARFADVRLLTWHEYTPEQVSVQTNLVCSGGDAGPVFIPEGPVVNRGDTSAIGEQLRLAQARTLATFGRYILLPDSPYSLSQIAEAAIAFFEEA